MEDIIKSIKEAEERAAEIKAQALTRAAEIAERAEDRSAEIEKNSEAECKAYSERQLKIAREEAQAKYNAEIAQKRAEAVAYAEECLKNTDLQVKEIVRRVTGGGC